MTGPGQRIRWGAGFLGAVFVLAVVGYRFLGDGYDWIDAIWMVVITISSVGYGESSSQSPVLQLFTIAVIIFGMSAAAYTMGGFIELMAELQIDRALGRRRMTRDIDRLRNHIIVCGYGRMGAIIAQELAHRKRTFVVIESSPEDFENARSHGYLCLMGDAQEEEVLIEAGVEKAKTLVSTFPNDAANVFITLTARNLCPKIFLIARAERESTRKKLLQAGVDQVVLPAMTGAKQMVRLITHPSTAQLMELVGESSFSDYQVDELTVHAKSKLVGMSVRRTEAHRKHRLLVIAIKQVPRKQDPGNMVFNPDAEHIFREGDIVILMGHLDDISEFRKQYDA